MTPFHSAARSYAASGIPVFPCAPGTKRPATDHGFHDATTNLDQIDAWWAQWPEANPAFSPHMVGWGIVDIDSAEALHQFTLTNVDQPPTWTVRTPRNGLHLYYEGELPTSVARRVIPGQAIDTRGKGSYALLPPSRTEDGTYTVETDADVAPLPAWITQAVADTNKGGAVTTAPDVDLDIPANVDRAKRFLRDAAPAIEGEHGDERTFVVACTLQNLGISREMALEIMAPWNERCDPPWDDEELAIKVENAYGYAQNAPGVHAVTGSPSETFAKIIGAPVAEAQTAVAKRGRFYPEDETEQEEGGDPPWMIKDLIPDAETVMIQGKTQSYKSFVALDLALSVASGAASFAGEPVRQGPVFYAALEGRSGIKKKRRRAWKIAHQVAAVPNFYVMPGPMVALPDDVVAFMDAIEARLDGRQCAGIVIDTLAKGMAGLNENDARDAGQFIHFMDTLAERFACPAIAIHHLGKDESRGGRGSSAIHAGFSVVIEIEADHAVKMLKVRVLKQKESEEREEPWYLEGKQVAQSLVFQAISREEYETATKAESLFTHKRIGAALKALGAIGDDKAVTTFILAGALVEHKQGESVEAREKKLASTTKMLTRMSKDSLMAYLNAERAWCLPAPG